MLEYDELVNESHNIIEADPKLKDIGKFGIGHNIQALTQSLRKINQNKAFV